MQWVDSKIKFMLVLEICETQTIIKCKGEYVQILQATLHVL